LDGRDAHRLRLTAPNDLNHLSNAAATENWGGSIPLSMSRNHDGEILN
jgi:hypothetical protein